MQYACIVFTGPYVPEVTERGKHFFEAHGFAVTNAVGLGISDDHAPGSMPLEEVSNFRTIGVLAALERDLDKPVVSATQASFWQCLRLSGVGDAADGDGRLLTLPPTPDGHVRRSLPR